MYYTVPAVQSSDNSGNGDEIEDGLVEEVDGAFDDDYAEEDFDDEVEAEDDSDDVVMEGSNGSSVNGLGQISKCCSNNSAGSGSCSHCTVGSSGPSNSSTVGSSSNISSGSGGSSSSSGSNSNSSNSSGKNVTPYKTEVSHVLSRTRMANGIRAVGAIDAGVRFPIAVAAYQLGQSHVSTYAARKNNLYQYENELSKKIECLKTEEVRKAERQLGSSGTKNSYSFTKFVKGYFMDWISVGPTLTKFYSSPTIVNMQFHKAQQVQRLYDCHVERIFHMLGCGGMNKVNRGEIVFALEDNMIGTWHGGGRASKHAVFWKYFVRKASLLINYHS